ncbi:MAG: signal peptide peptidase SppA [Planctomycetes bacterium]|nr:signal peptide peptidase SppA [Planctomycetota bacterium]
MIRSTGLLLLCALAPLSAQAEVATKAPNKAAKAEPNSKSEPAVLYLRPSGVYADLPEMGVDLTSVLTGGNAKPKAFYELVERLEELSKEPSQELLLDLTGSFGMNLAQMSEMERCLAFLRRSGKRITAYLEHAGSLQIQLASQCDRVVMADMGMVELPSVAMSITFMKDALDLLGVHMDVVRCGDFKGAVEPYVLSQMSVHLRKHYLAMLGSINDDIVRRVATGRKLPATKVRALQEHRILPAKQAQEAGLVDDLVPWTGAKSAFAKVTGRSKVAFTDVVKKKKRETVNVFSLLSNLFNPKQARDKIDSGVVVLHLSGAIVDGEKSRPGNIVSGPTVRLIHKLRGDSGCKAVVVRINSPGGSATASEAILLALKSLAKAKPVVCSMGRVAASGGYYVTCFGKAIFAEASTITGSIGVFGMKPSTGALMRRVGLHEEVVALDEGAYFTADRPWSGEHKATIQRFIDDVYDRFTSHVAASRDIPVTEVLKIAGGRVWSGEQAKERRLVDHLGGLADAVTHVANQAKLEPGYAVTHLPRPADSFAALVESMMGAKALLPPAAQRVLGTRPGLETALQIVFDQLTASRPTYVWAMLPESLRLR